NELKNKLPAWYHISATKRLRRLDNTNLSKCLRRNHGVTYVSDIMVLARHDFIPVLPPDTPVCSCTTCKDAEEKGCQNTLNCVEAARRLLTSLTDKWNPTVNPVPDGLTLTPRRHDNNSAAFKKKDGEAVFNPSVTERGGISEIFRVFMDDNSLETTPNMRQRQGTRFQ
ncbi:uncharacterized protein C8Q71DRAFT_675458, partial [Rhodofomes roseus]